MPPYRKIYLEKDEQPASLSENCDVAKRHPKRFHMYIGPHHPFARAMSRRKNCAILRDFETAS